MNAIELAAEMVRAKRITWRAFTRDKVRVVARELIFMATPVQIRRPMGFCSFACRCGGFPSEGHAFCFSCGRPIHWIENAAALKAVGVQQEEK